MNNNKWAIIGCTELQEHFSTIPREKRSSLDGNSENQYYYINDNGNWDGNWLSEKPADIELITVADYLFKLPEKWCVRVADDNKDILNTYMHENNRWYEGYESVWQVHINGWKYLHYKSIMHNKLAWGADEILDSTEITTEQFIKHVLKQTKMNTQTLTRAQLITLHSGDSCADWRKEIEAILLSAPLALDTTSITIPQKSIDLLIKKGSATQKSLVMSAGIKLEEDKSVEVPPAAIQEQRLGVLLGTRNGGEYKNKSFYLNNSLYNWELKTDSMGTLCLIPTKK